MKYSLNNYSLPITFVTLLIFLIAWPISFYGFQKYKGIEAPILFDILFYVSVLV